MRLRCKYGTADKRRPAKSGSKINRLKRYFGPADRPEIYDYDPHTDESVDWQSMTDAELATRLGRGQ